MKEKTSEAIVKCGLEARLLMGVGGLFTVEITDTAEEYHGKKYDCRAKGAFRKEHEKPLPGDMVKVDILSDKTGFITEILPRRNTLIRPASANIDIMLFVIAAAKPDPDLFLIDKMTAVLRHNDIDVLMVINKSDIGNAAELCDIYSLAGIRAVPFCASMPESPENAESARIIKESINGKVCFLAGASGVGKSSTVNALFPEFSLETGDISRKIERGKHTTRKTELIKIGENTYIADTPGFSMLEISRFGMIPKEGLLSAFPDIEKYAVSCRYTDCTHCSEDGCQVINALNEGKIAKSRHESFKTLYHELKAQNEWDVIGWHK